MTRRITMVLVALAAIGLSALWLAGIVEIFDPEFNPKRRIDPPLLAAQTILGALGIISLLSAAFYAVQHLQRRGGNRANRSVAAFMLGLAVFAGWLYLALGLSSS